MNLFFLFLWRSKTFFATIVYLVCSYFYPNSCFRKVYRAFEFSPWITILFFSDWTGKHGRRPSGKWLKPWRVEATKELVLVFCDHPSIESSTWYFSPHDNNKRTNSLEIKFSTKTQPRKKNVGDGLRLTSARTKPQMRQKAFRSLLHSCLLPISFFCRVNSIFVAILSDFFF